MLIPKLLAYADTLRFPRLVLVTGALFVINLFIPDMIPFADEILLGLATLVLTRMKRANTPIDVTQSPPPNPRAD